MGNYIYVMASDDVVPPTPPTPPIDDPIYFDSKFKDYVVYDGENLKLSSGFTAENTMIKPGGWMMVLDGATASDTKIDQSAVQAVYGGVADNISCFSGGWLLCDLGGKITGEVKLGGTMLVYSNTDASEAELTFSIDQRKETDPVIIDNMANISGGDYCVSVKVSQESGTYNLAGGVDAGFTSLTLVTTAGKEIAELSVGNTVEVNGRTYTLNLAGGTLSLTVGGEAQKVVGDLDGNGLADVMMTHSAGFVGAWLIQPDQTAKWGDLSTINGTFKIMSTGDLDGNGTDDVILYDSTSHVAGAWMLNANGKVSSWQTIQQFDNVTTVVGGGNFGTDGKYDLLLRNDNGAIGFYFTDGRGWNYIQSVGAEWTVAGIGDLNGDGLDDVIIHHDAGFTGSWITLSDGTVAWRDLDNLSDVQRIAGTGDFNGDGIDDVLIYNETTRNAGAWLMDNNGNISGWMGLGTLNQNVTIEEIGDFNGDGVDDLRIRANAGDIGCMLVLGEDQLEWNYYGSLGSEWTTKLA